MSAAIVGGGLAFLAVGMALTVAFKPIRIALCAFGLLGAIGAWFAPAMDASQYEWFRWYDGLLFPLRVLITPGYYRDLGGLMMLVLPSLVILAAVGITAVRLVGEVVTPVYADAAAVADLRDDEGA